MHPVNCVMHAIVARIRSLINHRLRLRGSVFLFIVLSVCPSIHTSIYLSVYLSVYRSIIRSFDHYICLYYITITILQYNCYIVISIVLLFCHSIVLSVLSIFLSLVLCIILYVYSSVWQIEFQTSVLKWFLNF